MTTRNKGTREQGNKETKKTRKNHGGSPRSLNPSFPHSRSLTHVDAHGRVQMVNVSDKPATLRQAVARGEVRMTPQALGKIKANAIAKGDVLAVAHVAAVMAVKRTDELIPVAQPLPLIGGDVSFLRQETVSTVEAD